MSAVIRMIVPVVEETHPEMGQVVAPPTRRAPMRSWLRLRSPTAAGRCRASAV